MFWQLLQHSKLWVFPVPHHAAEETVALHFARQFHVRIQQRNDACRVIAHHIHHAHHAVVVHHTHLGHDAVGLAAVDGDVIVRLRHAVANHMCQHIVELCHHGLNFCRVGNLHLHIGKLALQVHHLHLEGSIALLQFLVDVLQVEV